MTVAPLSGENTGTDLATAERVVAVAREWIGTPYRHQASVKGVGCDCLGLVRGIWREVEGAEPQQIPAYSSAWSEVGQKEQLLDVAARYFVAVDSQAGRAGDLLIFRMRRRSVAKHVGVLCDRDNFIHAYGGNRVTTTHLCDFWRSRIAGVFRFPSVEATARKAGAAPHRHLSSKDRT